MSETPSRPSIALHAASSAVSRSSPDHELQARAVVELVGIEKQYQTRTGETVPALRAVTLRINEGEFISVIGPSGCGKTTLLKMVAGLVRPTAGSIHIAGQPIAGPTEGMALVFQAPVLLPWLRVSRNISLPLRLHHRNNDGLTERVNNMLDLLGLEGFGEKYPNELSGGMQQRVSIGRALIQDPSVLLMDEPFGALDALTRERLNVELERIWLVNRKTVLFVTHSIQEAIFLSDRIVVMSDRPGEVLEIVTVGWPRPRDLNEIQSDPQFARTVAHLRILLERGRP